MDYINILKELTQRVSVSGREDKIALYLKELFEKYCDRVEVDKFYNTIGVKKGSKDSKKKIMITAHVDEIGFLVTGIDEKGFIRFSNVGGIDSKILLAQEVTIHGRSDITGIIGAVPPHLLKEESAKKPVKIKELCIDTGLKASAVKNAVSIGDVITVKSPLITLQDKLISSKSVDNRCGITALLGVMKEAAQLKNHPELYYVATSQEEVTLAGVITASYNIKPDIAVVVDACHGDMPDTPKEETYKLGKGPAVGVGPNLHKGITGIMIETAKDEGIPYQIDVEPGDTGTEAWATQVSRSGIPTVLVSIPVRYMHTPVETVHIDDIKNAGRLIAGFIKKIGDGTEEITCC